MYECLYTLTENKFRFGALYDCFKELVSGAVTIDQYRVVLLERIKEYLNPMVITAYAIFFLSTFLTMYALKYVPLTYSPIIEPLSYIFVPVIGVLVLKEKISRRRVLGITIMLVGIVVFSM